MIRQKIISVSTADKGGGASFVEEKRSMSKFELFLRSVMSGNADSINARFGTSDIRNAAISAINHAPVSPVYMEMGDTHRVINLAERAKERIDKAFDDLQKKSFASAQEKEYFEKFKKMYNVDETPKGAGENP